MTLWLFYLAGAVSCAGFLIVVVGLNVLRAALAPDDTKAAHLAASRTSNVVPFQRRAS